MTKLCVLAVLAVFVAVCAADGSYERRYYGSRSYRPSYRPSYYPVVPVRYSSSSSHKKSRPVCSFEWELELQDLDLSDTVKCKAGNSDFWKCKVRSGYHSSQISIPVDACQDYDKNLPVLLNGVEVNVFPTSSISLSCNKYKQLKASGGGINEVSDVDKIECGGQCAVRLGTGFVSDGAFGSDFGPSCPLGGSASVGAICIIPNGFSSTTVSTNDFCNGQTNIVLTSEGELESTGSSTAVPATLSFTCVNGKLGVSSVTGGFNALSNVGTIGCT